MRRPLIAGNWKLNGSRESALELAADLISGSADLSADLLVCPSFTLLNPVREALAGSPVALGAQNVSAESSGAFTGEVSAAMLAEAGCAYAIIGHSERRTLYAEQDRELAAKVLQALSASLTPILCVGESLAEREQERQEAVVQQQLDAALGELETTAIAKCVIAYEPVWAIGTGRSASPQDAQAVHASIRAWLGGLSESLAPSVRLLYGGSVKPDSASALFEQTDIDGALVGGASLNASDFLAIARAAAS